MDAPNTLVGCSTPVRDRRNSRDREAGFTLIELLVVVSVLIAVSVIAAPSIIGVVDSAQQNLATTEMRRLADGILRFRQDTGFFPRQGPFALTGDGGQVVADPAEPLNVPANLVQLIEAPVDGTANPILPWNTDTGRGWNGPYVTTFGEGTVTVGEDFAANGAIANGPLSGTARRITGVADPFDRPPEGAYLEWEEPISGRAVPARGRPYALFVDPGADANVDGCLAPCLLSFGPNGRYEAGTGDDIVLNF